MSAPRIGQGTIVSVNVSTQKGQCKCPVRSIFIGENGIQGDAHAGPGLRQVSLLSMESIRRFSASAERDFQPGEFAENLTSEGLDLSKALPLDRFLLENAVLEVTQIGKSCHGAGCAVFQQVGRCVMPKEGVFCRVLTGGAISPGDSVRHTRRSLNIRVITVSDRASRNECEDISGPRVRTHLESYFYTRPWHFQVENQILPDDRQRLQEAVADLPAAGVSIAILTGGTGLGPRDVTPDAVLAVADKVVPGIMEHIRAQYGPAHPNALLSRSVAAAVGQTLVYAIPGSPRAVDEYMTEILKSVEHAVLMIHGLGH